MLAAIMFEPATYTENGVEYVSTRLELLVRTISIATAKGNHKARHLHDLLSGYCDTAGRTLPISVLITQGKMSEDDWVMQYRGSANGRCS